MSDEYGTPPTLKRCPKFDDLKNDKFDQIYGEYVSGIDQPLDLTTLVKKDMPKTSFAEAWRGFLKQIHGR